MAHIPELDISTRRLDTYQPRHITPSDKGVNLQNIGRTVQWGGDQLDRIFEVQRRADEREGEFAVMQGVDFVKNGWNGYDSADEKGGVKHNAGVVDRTYADLKAEDTDPGKEMAKLSKAVREQEFYTKLSPAQKRVFERKWQFKQNEFNRAAHDHTQKLALAHKVEQDKAEIAWNGQRAGDKYGSKKRVIDPRTGAEVSEWEYTANWAGLRNFAIEQGTAITNPEILDNPNARFEDLKWRGNISPEELAKKRDRYQDQVAVFYINRITALQQAGANNQSLGQYSAAECLTEADRMCEELKKNTRMRRGPNGEVVPMFNPDGLNAVKKETDKARQLREGKRSAAHKVGASTLALDFKKRTEGLEETKKLIEANLDTRDDYNRKLDAMVFSDTIDEKTAEEYKKAYGNFLDYRESIITAYSKYEKTGKGGVMVVAKDRNGNKIDVFQPNRIGNGKTQTDPTFASKYTMKNRDGKTRYFDNPAEGMEELDFDLRMGKISVDFYNAQMAEMRVLADTKAKVAFVKIFGAEPTIFPEKDVEAFKKQGVDISPRTIWAKNNWWGGNHTIGGSWDSEKRTNIGGRVVSWQEDALKGDGGEYKVSLEQQAQVCEMVLSLSREGIDPTDAVQAYLAPTEQAWWSSDLSNRLDPNFRINGKTFREWVLESKRFGGANAPAEREKRIQARQKAEYEKQN